MSGRKPGRKRRRPRKWARRPRAVRVRFEEGVCGKLPDMIVLRTGAPCANNRRGTIVTAGAWSGLRVNFDAIRPGKFIKALTGNADILAGSRIGTRVLSVESIKQW